MSFFDSVFIKKYLVSENLDSFGRLRVANLQALFDSKQIGGHPLGNILFVSKSINGGTEIYDDNTSSTTIAVTSASGSRMIHQSRQRMNYFPGRGLEIKKTFVLGAGSAGVVKRIGYFDEFDGVYLEQSGSDLNLVLRESTTGVVRETRVSQSNWNIDRFDGSTDSDFQTALDVTKAQILDIDFQWLGAGRLRVGFSDVSGSNNSVHYFNNANLVENVYMKNPNLPVRHEIENFEGTTSNSLKFICSSVSVEGSSIPVGLKRSVHMGTGSVEILQGERRPLISLKLKSGSINRNVAPTQIEILSTTTTNFLWELLLNPTFSGSVDDASWIELPNSATEYDFSRTTLVESCDVVLGAGYGSTTKQSPIVNINGILSNFILGSDVDGVSDNIVLAVTPLATANFLGQIDFTEID